MTRREEPQCPGIADFLLARIAEDESVAREDLGDWQADGHPLYGPARILAACKAYRAIVDLSAEYTRRHDVAQDADDRWALWNRSDALKEAIAALALPYADHPDYDESWRP